MLTKNQAKFIHSLKQKKNRGEQGLFIAEGVKIVSALCGLNSGIKVKQIYSSTNFQLSIFNYQLEVIRVKASELKRISSLVTPNEVLAICEIPKYDFEISSLKNKLCIVLDAVQDPGNLGTIIRIADWFGIENIICSEDTVDVYNQKVIQATMGSIARVKVHYVELVQFFSEFQSQIPNSKIYGTLPDGSNIYENNLSKTGLIVMGNESKGISQNLFAHITDKISIPNYGKEAESLNVAIAAAVICAEFKRKG